MTVIEVVAALIMHEDNRRILLCQRPAHKARGGLWEFVGGKVEPGETKAQALIRECREELGVVLETDEEVIDVTHAYPDLTVHLTLMRARIASGDITLFEHQDARWAAADELSSFALCPADAQMVELIQDRLI
ncbi:MAG: (deoxy)nucleoside triphosphate pyrophosphohydrolase [Clostridia bacterium]|nr:(deoxy)nucleoside triphosphate pyrophosphohydrolase [Clostridia bacterium]